MFPDKAKMVRNANAHRLRTDEQEHHVGKGPL